MNKINKFVELLLEYNQIHNITGAKNSSIVMQNIEDSLYPMKYINIDSVNRALDVGTGAGFPGLVIAMKYPNVKYTLCEPILKKSAFLHMCKVELELDNVSIVSKRVEELSGIFDLITSRAVCKTKQFLDITNHVSDKDTKILLYKGSSVDEELVGIKHILHNHQNRNYIILGHQ